MTEPKHDPQHNPSAHTPDNDLPLIPPPWVQAGLPSTPPPFGAPDGVLLNSLFSVHGRMGRLSMMAAGLGLIAWFILFSFVAGILFAIVGISGGMSHGNHTMAGLGMGLGFMVFIGISVIAMLVYMNIFYVRRLHDLNHSGWWIAVPIVLGIIANVMIFASITGGHTVFIGISIINLCWFAYLTLAPGSKGANRFGPPRFTSSTEKVFGWIAVVLFALDIMFVWSLMRSIGQFPPDPRKSLAAYSTAATSAPVAGTFTAPYPFDATALWNNLLKITALPTGQINVAEVETALGTHLHTENLPLVGASSITSAGKDWYFSLRINDMKLFGMEMHMFTFNWDDIPGPDGLAPPTGMCIKLDQMQTSLTAQGWTPLAVPANPMLTKQDYSKPNGATLSIVYDPTTQCMRQLMLMVAKKAAG